VANKVASAIAVVVFLTVMAFRVLATPSPIDPFAFFQPSLTITADDRRRLDGGDPVAHVIASKDPEVAVWAAVPVAIEGDRLVSWMHRIEELKRSTYVLAIGRFSDPPRLDDLADLSLDEADASDFSACRPAHCDFKLSAAEMTALQHAGEAAGALQQRFRQVVLDRVKAYLSGGRIGPYADTASEVWPGQEFDTLLAHSAFLITRASSFAESLRRPRGTSAPGGESFLYWSKERLGAKPIISVTDVRILRGGDDAGGPAVVVAGKQIFATHYVNASLGVTALVRGEPGGSNYLVYVNRSRVDMLHGTFAAIVRWVMQRRLKAEAGNVLEGLRRRLESGEPPPGAVAASRDRGTTGHVHTALRHRSGEAEEAETASSVLDRLTSQPTLAGESPSSASFGARSQLRRPCCLLSGTGPRPANPRQSRPRDASPRSARSSFPPFPCPDAR
jgi:hypothetical protein